MEHDEISEVIVAEPLHFVLAHNAVEDLSDRPRDRRREVHEELDKWTEQDSNLSLVGARAHRCGDNLSEGQNHSDGNEQSSPRRQNCVEADRKSFHGSRVGKKQRDEHPVVLVDHGEDNL